MDAGVTARCVDVVVLCEVTHLEDVMVMMMMIRGEIRGEEMI